MYIAYSLTHKSEYFRWWRFPSNILPTSSLSVLFSFGCDIFRVYTAREESTNKDEADLDGLERQQSSVFWVPSLLYFSTAYGMCYESLPFLTYYYRTLNSTHFRPPTLSFQLTLPVQTWFYLQNFVGYQSIYFVGGGDTDWGHTTEQPGSVPQSHFTDSAALQIYRVASLLLNFQILLGLTGMITKRTRTVCFCFCLSPQLVLQFVFFLDAGPSNSDCSWALWQL